MYEIFIRTPINGTAAIVTSQSGCSSEQPLTREELIRVLDALKRKRRLMAHILGVKNRRQHKNMMYRYNKKGRSIGGHKEPRLLREYVNIGESMQRINREIEALKKSA